MIDDEPRRPGVGYLLLAFGVAVVAVTGYTGYVLYPRFDLPAVEGAALLGLAAAAGLGSFFSPCSFPLLLALLGRTPGNDRDGPPPLRFAGALAAGAAVFMVLLGAAVAGLGAGLFADVTFASPQGIALRATVGVVLIALGAIQSGVVLGRMKWADRLFHMPLARRQARLRRERPLWGYGLFGFGYVLAGFGWTGPITAGLAAYALTIGGFAAAFAAFCVAAVVLVGLLFVAALTTARAQEGVIARVQAHAPAVKRWSGVLLIVIGVWFLTLAALAEFFADLLPV